MQLSSRKAVEVCAVLDISILFSQEQREGLGSQKNVLKPFAPLEVCHVIVMQVRLNAKLITMYETVADDARP
jgi:hypothetical protein